MKMTFKSILISCVIATLFCLNGCYSFTGASIDPKVKTVSVALFPNYAPIAQVTVSQKFTEALKDVFISQTNLTLVRESGDLRFEGAITRYEAVPLAIQGNEVAAQTRLNMTVNVKFTNTVDETQSFERSFTQFEDFSSTENLSAVEDQLIESINEKLTQDIFNASVSNW
ncbi:LptE family protein [bacterium]|nr:LptE family protein [bacterium]